MNGFMTVRNIQNLCAASKLKEQLNLAMHGQYLKQQKNLPMEELLPDYIKTGGRNLILST